MKKEQLALVVLCIQLILSCTFGCETGYAYAPGIIFQDDFESYSIGDVQAPWSNTSPDKTLSKVTIVADPAKGSARGKVLKLQDLPNSANPTSNTYTSAALAPGSFADQKGTFILEYDYYADNKSTMPQLYSREMEWPYAIGVTSVYTGSISPAVNPNAAVDVNRFPKMGTWHKIAIEADVVNQKYRFSLDYTKKTDWITFRSNGSNPSITHKNIFSLIFVTTNDVQRGCAYIDNVRMYETTLYSHGYPTLSKPQRTFWHEDFQCGNTSRWLNNINAGLEGENYFLNYNQPDQTTRPASITILEGARPFILTPSALQFSTDFRISTLTPSDAAVSFTLAKNTSPAADGLSVGMSANGLLSFEGGAYSLIENTAISKGEWHQLKIVYTIYTAMIDIYLDGVLKKTISGWTNASFGGEVTQLRIDSVASAAGGNRSFDFDNMGIFDVSAVVPGYMPSVTPAPAGANTATDTIYNTTVALQAAVNATTPSITLQWRKYTSATTTYTVQRKLQSESSYTTIATGISSEQTSYIDTTVIPGTLYDYNVMRVGTGSASGNITCGINIASPHEKGKVILLIDNAIKDKISDELQMLRDDLRGEGWIVIDSYANRTDDPQTIRSNIKAIYNADSANVKSLYIIGHVPIKYYGYLSPDGHDLRPFPCDQYYADMTESNVWLSDAQCQSTYMYNIPGNIQLSVGRVDFFDMPSFSAADGKNLDEVGLMKRYLKKNHNFRTGKIAVARKSFLDDTLFQYNFATKNFAQITGGIDSMDFNKAVGSASTFRWYANANTYLWGLKLGGGSFISCGGAMDMITSDYTTWQDKNIMFLGMYGSYFGEYQRKDNLVRATLTGKDFGLGALWINEDMNLRPLGTGSTIGSAMLEYQNLRKYIYSQYVGDPTLTMYPAKTVSTVKATKDINNIYTVNWNAVSGAAGYYVYMANDSASPFVLRTISAVQGTSFTDTAPAPATAVYMVRPYSLETTPSGTFYNLATGVATNQASVPSLSMDSLRMTDGNGFSVHTVKANTTIVAQANMTNNLTTPKNGTFIMALYEGTPLLSKLQQVSVQNVAFDGLQEKTVTANINIPATGNYFVRIFMWEDMSAKPLLNNVVFPAS